MSRTQILGRLRQTASTAVLLELRRHPGELWTVAALAAVTGRKARTVREALDLGMVAGFVCQAPVLDSAPEPVGYTLTDEGRAFAATIRVRER